MSDDTRPVPEPGEANRGDDAVHWHDVDETNVRDADRTRKPAADEPQPAQPRES